jgi:hypothetical protein
MVSYEETKSTLDPMHKKSRFCHWGETTSFYEINATLVIGGIRREKDDTFITRRHHHCEG